MVPELLKMANGETVADRAQWEALRRPEILDLFQDHVYGRRPVEKPEGLHFSLGYQRENYLGHRLKYKQLWIKFPGYAFRVNAFIPYADKPVPAFVYDMHDWQMESTSVVHNLNESVVPVLDITSRGYAVFVLYNSEIYPDLEAGAKHDCGVFGQLGPKPSERRPNDWASIAAWSWGMSRVMDYIETDSLIDSHRVATIGHSRGGKTALWAAAMDTRFAMAFSNASGCLGAAVLRGKHGEHIKDILVTDWFCDNLKQYADKEEALPVDQHMLIAAMAPRPVYVESCSLDDWASPEYERLSCRLASEVYEKLYGKTGVVLPPEGEVQVDTAYHEGNIGYHVRTGPHSITPADWNFYMDYRDAKGL